jgi:hypothetical protein
MFLYQKATKLHATDQNWDFAVRYNGDVFAINRQGGSVRNKRTDIHVLSRESDYTSFSLQLSTPLGRSTADLSSFGVDFNGDLFMFLKRGSSPSKNVEVHVLTAASGYRQFRLQIATALHPVDGNWELLLGPDNDLYAINKKNRNNKTEVHILRSSNNYQTFAFQKVTALHQSVSGFSFAVSPNRDVYAAKHDGRRHRTEYHVLSAEADYQAFNLQTETDLNRIDNSWKLVVPQPMAPGFISRRGAGSNRTEIHVPGTIVPSTAIQTSYLTTMNAMSDQDMKDSAIECGIQIGVWGAHGAADDGVEGFIKGAIAGALASPDCRKLVKEAFRDRDREAFEKMDKSNHDLEVFERNRNIA